MASYFLDMSTMVHYLVDQWFPTGVPQGGARGASSYYIPKDILAILTTRGAVYLNNPVR